MRGHGVPALRGAYVRSRSTRFTPATRRTTKKAAEPSALEAAIERVRAAAEGDEAA